MSKTHSSPRHGLTIEAIDARFSEHGIQRLGPYINNRSKIECECVDCKALTATTWDQFSNQGVLPRCRPCAKIHREALAEGKRLGIDKVRRQLSEMGVELRQDVYKRKDAPLRCKCMDCDADAFVRYDHLVTPSRTTPTFPRCSEHRLNALPRGNKHPNWKSGAEANPRRGNRDTRFAEWERKVKRLSNWTCSLTGKRGGQALSSHHLYSWNTHPELRYEVSNGVCVSRALHKLFHEVYGAGYNNLDQWIEFASWYSQGLLTLPASELQARSTVPRYFRNGQQAA